MQGIAVGERDGGKNHDRVLPPLVGEHGRKLSAERPLLVTGLAPAVIVEP
jgi:hypothetical protein